MMLGGWLNAVACVFKKRIRHLLFPPISRPRFDPVSSLMRPANPELGHRLEPASIPTVNQPRTGKTPISSLGANARHIAWLGGSIPISPTSKASSCP
jgi:hypothetical protein